MGMDAFKESAARINNLIRLYNLREGAPPDTEYPKVWLTQPLKRKGAEGEVVSEEKLKGMLKEYYRLRGWSD